MDRLECGQVHGLIDAAVDGELDLLARLSFDAHLADCPDCAAVYAARRQMVTRLRDHAERHVAPEALRARVLAALPNEATPGNRRPVIPRRWLVGGACGGSLAALAASLVLFLAAPSPPDLLDRDLVAAHIRSLMPDHLTDVASTDQHTVKPWFDGRLALSPPVPNLAEEGFPLIGGRLDYVDQHTAAALVYRRAKHVINLFVWTLPGAPDHAPDLDNRNGYNILRWVKNGEAYAAVSDVNRVDLEAFQRLWVK
jgi:anti-sigma factor RsiW